MKAYERSEHAARFCGPVLARGKKKALGEQYCENPFVGGEERVKVTSPAQAGASSYPSSLGPVAKYVSSSPLSKPSFEGQHTARLSTSTVLQESALMEARETQMAALLLCK